MAKKYNRWKIFLILISLIIGFIISGFSLSNGNSALIFDVLMKNSVVYLISTLLVALIFYSLVKTTIPMLKTANAIAFYLYLLADNISSKSENGYNTNTLSRNLNNLIENELEKIIDDEFLFKKQIENLKNLKSIVFRLNTLFKNRKKYESNFKEESDNLKNTANKIHEDGEISDVSGKMISAFLSNIKHIPELKPSNMVFDMGKKFMNYYSGINFTLKLFIESFIVGAILWFFILNRLEINFRFLSTVGLIILFVNIRRR